MGDPRPAGWYRDPNGSDAVRWWDGSAWTDRTAPAAQATSGGPFARPVAPKLGGADDASHAPTWRSRSRVRSRLRRWRRRARRRLGREISPVWLAVGLAVALLVALLAAAGLTTLAMRLVGSGRLDALDQSEQQAVALVANGDEEIARLVADERADDARDALRDTADTVCAIAAESDSASELRLLLELAWGTERQTVGRHFPDAASFAGFANTAIEWRCPDIELRLTTD